MLLRRINMGVKERRTKILLSLLLLSGLSAEASAKADVGFSPVAVDEKNQKIFDYSFNQKTKGTLSGLLKEEMIKKEGESYALTEKGFYDLCLQFPFFRFLKDQWDGKWRIISYEIPESKREIRDRLRREMQGWGLGPWHRSFWITPHPVITTLKNLVYGREEEKFIQAFESDHVFGDKEILIEKVWGKTQLDKKYRELFKTWHDILSKEGDKLEKLKKVIGNYINLLKDDPGLPKELLGVSWIGFEGFSIFREIKSILLS